MKKPDFLYQSVEYCKSRFIKKNSFDRSKLKVLSSNRVDNQEIYTNLGIPPQNITFVKEDIDSYLKRTREKFDIISLYFNSYNNNEKSILYTLGHRKILNDKGILMVDSSKEKPNCFEEFELKKRFSILFKEDLSNKIMEEAVLGIIYLINERFYNELSPIIKKDKENLERGIMKIIQLRLSYFMPLTITLYDYNKDNEQLNCNLFKLTDKMIAYHPLREYISNNYKNKLNQTLIGLIDSQPRWSRKQIKSGLTSCLDRMHIDINFEDNKPPNLNDFIPNELMKLVNQRIKRIHLLPPLPKPEEKKIEEIRIEEKPKGINLDELIHSLLKQKYLSMISQNSFLRMRYFVEDTLSQVGEEKTKQIANEVQHSKWYKRFGRNPRDINVYSFFDDITMTIRKGDIPASKDIEYMADNIIRNDKSTS